MQTETAHFYSDALKLDGCFYVPADFDSSTPQPVIIACSGFTGLNNIHPERFARFLTQYGYCCYGFDYRGFGRSEGPRGRVILEQQVRDIRHAITFVQSEEHIDRNRVVLLGWGMAGGLVLEAARHKPGVIGLIAANGFYNGRRVQLAHRGEAGLRDFEAEVLARQIEQVRSGVRIESDPFLQYPLDRKSREYVENVLKTNPDYDVQGYDYDLGDSLLRWDVEAHVARTNIPLLIAHGSLNELHPTSEAESLYESYGGPKEMYWISDAGHTEFMHDDDPRFLELGTRIVKWLRETVRI